jgi:ABC-type polysaccharide/polyol phosphate export permease
MSGFQVRSFLSGLTLTQLLTTLSTMIIVVLTLFFGLNFPIQGDFQIIFIIFLSIFAVLPLVGISLAVAATTDGQVSTYLPSIVAIPLTFLTGNFIPLPHIVLLGNIQLWHLNPFFCIGEALRKIMILNLDPSGFILDIFLLMISGTLIFLLGGIIFIKKAYK